MSLVIEFISIVMSPDNVWGHQCGRDSRSPGLLCQASRHGHSRTIAAISRRSTPEHIFQVRHHAIGNTLIGSALSLETGERRVRCMDPRGGRRGLPWDADYWREDAARISAARSARRPDPRSMSTPRSSSGHEHEPKELVID